MEQRRKKTGGRKKGTPNKVSGTVREMIKQAIGAEMESLPLLLDQLEPKERVDALVKLIPYIIPKVTEEVEQPKTFMEQQSTFVQNIVRHIEEKNRNQS